jgi:hypothetical protein
LHLFSFTQEKGQTYSVLLLFTNSSPDDVSKTEDALKEVDDAPLSVVIVGVGDGDFSGSKQLETCHEKFSGRDMVRFVPYKAGQDHDQLTEAALDPIPKQLETYFVSHEIYPEPESESNEIEVQPYDETADVEVPMVISEANEVTVTEDVKPPKEEFGAKILKLGKDLHKEIKRNKAVGKIKRHFNRKARGKAKQKINKLLGARVL